MLIGNKPIQKTEFENLKVWWDNRVENEQAWKVPVADLEKANYNLDIKNPHTPEVEHSYSSTKLLALLHESFVKSDALLSQLKKELVQ